MDPSYSAAASLTSPDTPHRELLREEGQESARIKSEAFAEACKENADMLSKIDAIVSAVVDATVHEQ